MLADSSKQGSFLYAAKTRAPNRKPSISAILNKGASKLPSLVQAPSQKACQTPASPINGTLSQMRRTDNSFHRSVHLKKSQISSYSSHNCTADDLPSLIKSCFVSMPHNVIPNPPTADPEDEFRQVTANLESILSLVMQNPATTAQLVDPILSLVKFHLLRTVSQYDPRLIYGDTTSTLFITNWQPLFFIHRLMFHILQCGDSETLNSMIDESFIRKFLDLFDSPDPNEQSSVEFLLSAIFDKMPGTRQAIFLHILSKVQAHLDREANYIRIAPSLRFFSTFFKGLKGSWSSFYTQIFKTSFFPLYETEFVSEFYLILSPLCAQFYTSNPGESWWSLSFLLLHWPLTNSTKQVAFLHQISVIAPYLQGDQNINILETLFSRIGSSISSENFKVSSAALKLVSDPGFLSLFKPIHRKVLPQLMTHVKLLKDHWSPDVKSLTFDAINAINMFGGAEAYVPTERAEGSPWRMIKSVASAVDPALGLIDVPFN